MTWCFGWWFREAGEVVIGVERVEKYWGLQNRKTVNRLWLIPIVSVRAEPAATVFGNDASEAQLERGGFPQLVPMDFIAILCKTSRKAAANTVNRIRFECVL